MTAGALDEVILPTLSENHASDLCFDALILFEMQGIFSLSNDGCVGQQLRQMNLATVSYTHLTLPTKLEV